MASELEQHAIPSGEIGGVSQSGQGVTQGSNILLKGIAPNSGLSEPCGFSGAVCELEMIGATFLPQGNLCRWLIYGVSSEWPSVKGLGFRGQARLGWHKVSVLVLDFAKAVTGARQSRVGFGAAFNSPRFSSTWAFRHVVVGDLMEEILEELAAHGMVSSLEESFAEPADA